MNLAWLAVAIAAWVVQYFIVVPLYVIWRLVAIAFSFGLVGILLLFVPIFGWIILGLWWLKRRSDKRHDEVMRTIRGDAAPKKRSILRPWFIDRLVEPQPALTETVAES